MVGSYYGEEELKEMFSTALDKQRNKAQYAIDQFLNILFWKDYKDGYVSYELRQDIYKVLDTVKTKHYGEDECINIDQEKAIIVANVIRKKIGLPQLKIEHGTLMEIKK